MATFAVASPVLAQEPSEAEIARCADFGLDDADVTARILGEHMSRTLGAQIVIENVLGAGGTTTAGMPAVTRRTGPVACGPVVGTR